MRDERERERDEKQVSAHPSAHIRGRASQGRAGLVLPNLCFFYLFSFMETKSSKDEQAARDAQPVGGAGNKWSTYI